MISKTEALVLHAIKYGEQKLIVDMFTRQHGRLSFMVPLSKSGQGRMKKQYFQPLTLLTIETDVRPQVQLQKLREAAILTPMPTLLTDATKLSISLFLSEFLYHALKGEQQNKPLFDYVTTSLEWLESRERDYANFHLVFLIHLSRFLGFYPNIEEPQPPTAFSEDEDKQGRRIQSFFDLRAATFCQTPPLHRDVLLPQEASMLQLMMRMDYATMHLFRLNRQQRDRCIEVALQFYRLHLPDFPELRSLSVLKDLWK